MKKVKRIMALALACVMVLSLLPFTAKEAKAEESSGYYVWSFENLGSGRAMHWETEGTPAVAGLENPITLSSTQYLEAKNYQPDGTALTTVTVTSQGKDYSRKEAYRLSVGNTVTFAAPCDGRIELHCRPRATKSANINIKLDGEIYGETMTLAEGQTNYAYLGAGAENNWVYEIDVTKGTSYVLNASDETALFQLTFIPSAASSDDTKDAGMIKAQYKKVADDNYTVRVVYEVAEADIANYSQIGAKLTVAGKTESVLGTEVFKSLTANGATVTPAEGNCFVVVQVTDVPANASITAEAVAVQGGSEVSLNSTGTIDMAEILGN